MVYLLNPLAFSLFSPNLETIFGIRIRMFGHSGRFERRSLVIMNHICHFDWLYFWGVMEHSGDLTSWKAITKDAIKKAPLVGRYIHCICSVVHYYCGL